MHWRYCNLALSYHYYFKPGHLQCITQYNYLIVKDWMGISLSAADIYLTNVWLTDLRIYVISIVKAPPMTIDYSKCLWLDYINLSHSELFLNNITKCICIFYHFSQNWDGAGSWNPSPWKTRPIYPTILIPLQGTRASTCMVLKVLWNILVSALAWLIVNAICIVVWR